MLEPLMTLCISSRGNLDVLMSMMGRGLPHLSIGALIQ